MSKCKQNSNGVWLSLVEYLNGVQVAAGSNPVTPTTSRQVFLACRDFYTKITAALFWLPLLFRKKARLLRLCLCKRRHNASSSLPLFCEFAPAALLIKSFSLFSKKQGNINKTSHDPEAIVFGNAVNYMNSCICFQPTVLEIADFCKVSEATLKRIFNKYSGTSIHKYFLKLKMKTAAELLASGFSVTEIAEKLGFGSQAYFSAAFKRETGISPSKVKGI